MKTPTCWELRILELLGGEMLDERNFSKQCMLREKNRLSGLSDDGACSSVSLHFGFAQR